MIDYFFSSKNKSTFLLASGFVVFLLSYMLISVSKIHNTIFYTLVLFPLLFCAEKKHFVELHKCKLINGLLLFLLYSTCTIFWSEFSSIELFIRTFKRLLYIYGLFLAIYIITSTFASFASYLIKYAAGLLSIFSCVCIYLFLNETGPHFLHDPIRMWGLGALYHPSFYAVIYLSFTMGLVAYFHTEDKYFRPMQEKNHFFATTMVILAIIVAILCDSRASVVSFVTMSIFYAFIERKFIWILTALAIVAILKIVVWQIDPNIFFARPSYRFELWAIFLDKWKECGYFFGCGMSGWKTTIVSTGEDIHMHAHSIYIGQLHTGGIVQLLSYIFLLLCFLYEGTLHKESKPWALILVAGMTMTLFDGSKILTTPSPLWITLLIPMSMIAAISARSLKSSPSSLGFSKDIN